MKKKGITWAALIGIILGVIVLLVMVGITYKLIFTEKTNACSNEGYWTSIKENLKNLDKEKTTTIFFKNEGCYLVSFSLNELSSLPSPGKIIPESIISAKKLPTICLCNIKDDTCTINNNLNNCYFFNEVINFKISGMQGQYNTANNKDMIYLFIKFEKQGSDISINDYVNQIKPLIPPQLIGPAPGPLLPYPVQQEQIA